MLSEGKTVAAVDRDGNVFEWNSLREFERDSRQLQRDDEIDEG